MPAAVEKKSTVKKRHARVAEEYVKWLEKNPSASIVRKFNMFDAISDSAYLSDQLNRYARSVSK